MSAWPLYNGTDILHGHCQSLQATHTHILMSFPWGQHSRPFLALSTKGFLLFPFYITHHFSYHYVGWFWAKDVTHSQELRPHFFISDCKIFVLTFCVVQFQTENATQSCKLSEHSYIVKVFVRYVCKLRLWL
jgi:hypothetical protein